LTSQNVNLTSWLVKKSTVKQSNSQRSKWFDCLTFWPSQWSQNYIWLFDFLTFDILTSQTIILTDFDQSNSQFDILTSQNESNVKLVSQYDILTSQKVNWVKISYWLVNQSNWLVEKSIWIVKKSIWIVKKSILVNMSIWHFDWSKWVKMSFWLVKMQSKWYFDCLTVWPLTFWHSDCLTQSNSQKVKSTSSR